MSKSSAGGSAAKSVAIAILVLLLAASTFLGWASGGFKNWDTSTWFEKTEASAGVAVDKDGNDLHEGEVYSLRDVVFRSAASLLSEDGAEEYPSLTLTATVEPSGAEQAVDWSVYWVDTEAEFAVGKAVTDYVTIIPASDGSTEADLECLQPFGAQIGVKATSRADASKSDSATVDFGQRFEAEFTERIVANKDSEYVLIDINPCAQEAYAYFKVKDIPYTVADEDAYIRIGFSLTGQIDDAPGAGMPYNPGDGYNYDFNIPMWNGDKDSKLISEGYPTAFTRYDFFSWIVSYSDMQPLNSEEKIALGNFIKESDPVPGIDGAVDAGGYFQFSYIVKSDYQNIEKTVPVYFMKDKIEIPVQNVTVTPGETVI